MKKYLYLLQIESLYTKISGDLIGKGEFRITVKDGEQEVEYPKNEFIQLGKNETFEPHPKPTILTGFINEGERKSFDVQILEYDKKDHDLFMQTSFSIHTEFLQHDITLNGIDDLCTLKLCIHLEVPELGF